MNRTMAALADAEDSGLLLTLTGGLGVGVILAKVNDAPAAWQWGITISFCAVWLADIVFTRRRMGREAADRAKAAEMLTEGIYHIEPGLHVRQLDDNRVHVYADCSCCPRPRIEGHTLHSVIFDEAVRWQGRKP